MKKFLMLAILITSSSSFAGKLDGLTFCRSVETGGFGHPIGTFPHCLVFENNRVSDNANSFFGNPPSRYKYKIRGSKIYNVDEQRESGYEIRGKTIVISETQAVLELR